MVGRDTYLGLYFDNIEEILNYLKNEIKNNNNKFKLRVLENVENSTRNY
jgi:hypothetical protein